MRQKMLPVLTLLAALPATAAAAADWPQWAQNAQHTGASSAAGQAAAHMLADIVYDPFVEQEKADPLATPDLLVHYQAPLIDGNDVYMEFKTGTYTSIKHWETQTWNERRLRWQGGSLAAVWNFETYWKPVPYGTLLLGPAWEPVFHPVLSGSFVYVPGAGGSIYKVKKSDGSVAAHVTPFGPTSDPDTFVCGPLTADAAGNVYYNVLQVVHGNAWNADVRGSWLVKVTSGGTASTVSYLTLIPGAPGANDKCVGIFHQNELPWPPSPDAVPATVQCGSQRAAVNLAPAVAPNGTIYTVSVGHLTSRTGYMVALNPNLTLKWATSLRDRLMTGCNVTIPPTGTLGGCRAGAHDGYDPAQNRPGAGRVIEDSTSSPVVAPDGSIFWGAYTRFNYAQGNLMKFGSDGAFLAAYPFGWDTTPAIYVHDGTYSVITKDNHYGATGSYCDVETVCPADRTANNPAYPEQYFITQLSKDLIPEWRWQNTNTLSCTRDASGNVSCVSDHPFGFEWCINGPAVDSHGVVYANSEDGNLYTINQGGTLRDNLFLDLALGAAYTPVAVGNDGKLYTQNDGHLFVVGR
jgi:hypothetical protein